MKEVLEKAEHDIVSGQQNTIISLSKEIDKMREENKHLRDMLNQNIRVVKLENADYKTEAYICKMQIEMLKEVSEQRVLTLEETKKLEIFNKIISTSTPKELDKLNEELKKMDSKKLLELI